MWYEDYGPESVSVRVYIDKTDIDNDEADLILNILNEAYKSMLEGNSDWENFRRIKNGETDQWHSAHVDLGDLEVDGTGFDDSEFLELKAKAKKLLREAGYRSRVRQKRKYDRGDYMYMAEGEYGYIGGYDDLEYEFKIYKL